MEMTMEEMVETLNRWAYEYYVLDAPSVSDQHYDALYDRLTALEKKEGRVLPDSPTRRIGGEPLKNFEKYNHLEKSYSLDKVQSFNELEAWVTKIKTAYPGAVFTVEYKYDGLNLSITYENGLLIRAVTRGNGVTGEVVTRQVETINSVPLSIGYKELIEVRGEGYMKRSSLAAYNEKHADEPLKNTRNGVAGAIRNLDPTVTAGRKLDMVFYSLGYNTLKLRSQTELNEFLKKNRFATNGVFRRCENHEEIRAVIEEIGRTRDSLDFDIDGVVIKTDDFALREELGYTEKFPRWAVAFKFEAEEVVTKLLKVTWMPGRTGKVTPIGHLKPVELCGATISRATLNNIGDIRKKSLKTNSDVYVRRSNDVIPEVLGLAEEGEDSEEINAPEVCPVCGTPLIERGALLYCPNRNGCSEQIVARLELYCSKDGADIEGLSEKTLKLFYEKLGVISPDGLYALKTSQLMELEGFKEKKAAKITDSIEKSKEMSLPAFLYALGIENVGTKTAADLAERYGSLEKIMQASVEELTAIEDIGEVVAGSIKDYFSDAENVKMIGRLLAAGVKPIYSEKKEGIFSGMKFVLTGELEGLVRSEAKKLIEEEGGEVMSSVTKNTDIVVAGENAGAKLEKALKLNVEIWDKARLIKELKK
jgi:DNA ligase (NAD+)